MKVLELAKEHKYIVAAGLVVIVCMIITAVEHSIGTFDVGPAPVATAPMQRTGSASFEEEAAEASDDMRFVTELLMYNIFTDEEGHYLVFTPDIFAEHGVDDLAEHNYEITTVMHVTSNDAETYGEYYNVELLVDGEESWLTIGRIEADEGLAVEEWAVGSPAFVFSDGYRQIVDRQ